jgi:hypothetical protein
MRSSITANEVRELLNYDPDTGKFTRRVSTGGRYGAKVGTPAGMLNDQGYWLISLKSLQYRAHRLAWLYMTGEWPKNEVDHLNGIRSDNRWANLRDVPAYVNQQNMRMAQSNSKTGLLGASWNSKDKRFCARIKANGRYMSLGYYDTAELAHEAYINAKRRLHEGCTI